MKTAILTSLCALLCTGALTAQAQTFTWADALKDSASTGSAVTTAVVAADHHNHIVAAGSFASTVHIGSHTFTAAGENNDGYLVKYDSGGNVLWAISIPVDSPGIATVAPHAIAIDKNDNIYVAGFYNNSVINFTPTDSLVNNVASATFATSFLAKYDANGNFLWAVDNNAIGACNAVTTDPFDNVIWAGNYVDTANFSGISIPLDSSLVNFYIAKYTADGKPVWVKIGRSLNIFSGQAIIAGLSTDNTGNIYTTGQIQGTTVFSYKDTISDPANSVEMFVAKFDTAGDMQWSGTESSGSAINIGNGIAVDNAGNAYVCGYLSDSAITMTIPFIAKYATTGAKKWLTEFGGAPGDMANSVALDANDYPYMIGDYYDSITIGSTTFNSGRYSGFITKFDTAGSPLWALSSKSGNALGSSICVDKNSGNVAISGNFVAADSFGANSISSILPNALNNYVAYISIHPKTTGITALTSAASVTLYPNPAVDKLYIANAKPGTIIKIYNIAGQSVYFGVISNALQTINISALIPGIYTVQLINTGTIQTIPLLKK